MKTDIFGPVPISHMDQPERMKDALETRFGADTESIDKSNTWRGPQRHTVQGHTNHGENFSAISIEPKIDRRTLRRLIRLVCDTLGGPEGSVKGSKEPELYKRPLKVPFRDH